MYPRCGRRTLQLTPHIPVGRALAGGGQGESPMPTRLVLRAFASLIAVATPAAARIPVAPAAHAAVAGTIPTSPVPNYPNPVFDPTPDFPIVHAADGTVVP